MFNESENIYFYILISCSFHQKLNQKPRMTRKILKKGIKMNRILLAHASVQSCCNNYIAQKAPDSYVTPSCSTVRSSHPFLLLLLYFLLFSPADMAKSAFRTRLESSCESAVALWSGQARSPFQWWHSVGPMHHHWKQWWPMKLQARPLLYHRSLPWDTCARVFHWMLHSRSESHPSGTSPANPCVLSVSVVAIKRSNNTPDTQAGIYDDYYSAGR